MRSIWLAALLTLVAIPAVAQGVAGTWNAQAETPTGQLPLVFDFIVKAGALTGTVSNEFMPKLPLEDIVVKNNALSFTLRTQLVTLGYKGTIAGDMLTLNSTVLEERAAVAGQGPTLGGILRSIPTIKATRGKVRP